MNEDTMLGDRVGKRRVETGCRLLEAEAPRHVPGGAEQDTPS